MLTADIRQAVWDAAQEAVAAGELPPVVSVPAGQPADPSTLRPGGGPGCYRSSLAFCLSGPRDAAGRAAVVLARRLAGVPWVAAAEAAAGQVSVVVTEQALTGVAVRASVAVDCAGSTILRGLRRAAPPPGTLAGCADWAAARDWVAARAGSRLAATAGADVNLPERLPPPPPAAFSAPSPVQAALDYAGADVVTFALLRPGGIPPSPAAADLPVRQHPGNPAYAVRYAHAHAASILRQATDLRVDAGEAEEVASRLLSQPQERALLGALSWLPERVAWAARQQRPGEFHRYLEGLASTCHDCWESCPALPFGGDRAPRDAATAGARLWLVAAARVALASGLNLLGVSAPGRL